MTTPLKLYLDSLPTLCVGQAADLKIDDGEIRIWLNRVTEEIEQEQLIDGRWVEVYDE